jgi:Rieske Fe-S protein
VRTAAGDVKASWVVVATHLPFLDRSLLFARSEPKMSYAVAVRARGRLPEGMLLSAGSPTRSLRTAPDPDRPGERVLLVGGEGHKTGSGGSTLERYRALVDWTTARFDVDEVAWRWATEDYVPDDSLPFVGPVWPLPTQVLVATGYAKWGFTNGTAAAMAMAATVAGEPAPDWAPDWDTRRLDLRNGARQAAKFNGDVAAKLVSGWAAGLARTRRLPPTVTPPDGEGGQLSGVCTHLGGIVRWNDGDGCWDCPLHGSRFEADGKLLHGPAVKDLHPT